MSINWSRLTDPFPAEDVEWKPGATTRDKSKGLAMAYITARAVQERLDEVFGPGNWKNEFRAGPDGGVICRIYFKNDAGEWVWREDGADNTDVEAVKGGLSNAMKRAGAALGIGRYLYNLPQQWVRLDERGRFAETPRIPRAFVPEAKGNAAAGSQHPAPMRPPPARSAQQPASPPPPPSVAPPSAAPPVPRAGERRVIRPAAGGNGHTRPTR
jgi:hypothetical protein